MPIYQDAAYRATQKVLVPQVVPAQIRPPLIDNNVRSQVTTLGPKSSAQFKPSNIEVTRPLRNVFPSSTYTTLTKIDENLIVVTEDDRFS